MEKNSYTIDKNVLILRTNCGEYNFKMDASVSADMIHRIAQLMIAEMAKAETSLNQSGPAVNPYIIGLLANLNLSKKYVELETRLETLGRTLKEKTKSLAPTTPAPQTTTTQPEHSPRKSEPDISAQLNTVDPEIIEDLQRINKLLSTADGAPKPCESADSRDTLPRPDVEPVPSIPEDPDETPGGTEDDEPPARSLERKKESLQTRKDSYTTDCDTRASQPDTDELKAEHSDFEVDALEIDELELEVDEPIVEASSADSPALDISDVERLSVDPPAIDAPEADADIGALAIDAPKTEGCGKDPDPSVSNRFQEKTSSGGKQDAAPPSPSVDNHQADAVTDSPKSKSTVIPAEVSADQTKSIDHHVTPHDETNESINEKPATAPDALPPSGFPIHTVMNPHPVEKASPAYDSNASTDTFELPTLRFLKNINSKTEVDHESIRRDAELLEKKLGYFGIKGEVMGVSPGPVITTFEYKPDPGIKISKIVNLADDLALALSAYSIRIVAPIPGKDVMGIEIPNLKKSIVPFIDIVSSADFINTASKLPICLGKDIIGNPVVVELESMPHLLIAGATGTGKSVGLNAMITSILYKANPDEVKFLMIDPKRIELSLYNDIPHLITPVITDMKKATTALQWMVREMERRYDLLAESQVRNIEQYNNKIKSLEDAEADDEPEFLSYIVIIIDELADLMMTASRDVELSLTRLAQMARAAGIHLILATQRPSVDVLTGIIKANFPTRISFQVSSKTDSRTIIDANGAETLLGMGDMLFVPPGTARLTRVHGTYVSEEELVDITSFLKAQQAPEYLMDVVAEPREESDQDYPDDEYDEKYNEALEVVMTTRQASISGVQRALRVGYNRAARIIDLMEKKGIVGPSDGSKPRQVLSGPMD